MFKITQKTIQFYSICYIIIQNILHQKTQCNITNRKQEVLEMNGPSKNDWIKYFNIHKLLYKMILSRDVLYT